MNIKNARVLLSNGEIMEADLTIKDGTIQDVGPGIGSGRAVDVRGKLVLPGIVDLHGDGFERHIMPRPGISFDLSLGLLDTDRTLTANGITTAYHGLTCSWEPGLRGRDAAHAFLPVLLRMKPLLGCDTRLQLRFETHNLPALEEIEQWVAQGKVDVLAFNDHVDSMFSQVEDHAKMSGYLHRTGLSRDQFLSMLDRIAERRDRVPAGIKRLAAMARDHGVPMASHDDPAPQIRTWYNGLGCTISEFPLNEATALAAHELANSIVLGAPNALRGGSHIDRLMAREAIQAGLCDVLTSDYYYPSLLQAPFVLNRENICDFHTAWNLVSSGPARAVGLDDRGTIEPGKRADLVVVDDNDPELPFAVMTLSGGHLVFSASGLGY